MPVGNPTFAVLVKPEDGPRSTSKTKKMGESIRISITTGRGRGAVGSGLFFLDRNGTDRDHKPNAVLPNGPVMQHFSKKENRAGD